MIFEELRLELPGDDTDDRTLRARDARAERTYEKESAGASPEEAATVAISIANQIRESDESDGKDDGKNAVTMPLTGGAAGAK
jgi:hypothetical protein